MRTIALLSFMALLAPAAALAQSADDFGEDSWFDEQDELDEPAGFGDTDGDVEVIYEDEDLDDVEEPDPESYAPVRGEDASEAPFHDELAPHGRWIWTEELGWVWQPRDIDEDWAPYTRGRWVYTDAGWAFVGTDPYADVVYHYGRWALIAGLWYWVPGSVWAPAWVSWRYGDGYVGWAPLGPYGVVHWGHGYAGWTFVGTRYFTSPYVYRHRVSHRYHRSLFSRTRRVARRGHYHGARYYRGPHVGHFRPYLGRRIHGRRAASLENRIPRARRASLNNRRAHRRAIRGAAPAGRGAAHRPGAARRARSTRPDNGARHGAEGYRRAGRPGGRPGAHRAPAARPRSLRRPNRYAPPAGARRPGPRARPNMERFRNPTRQGVRRPPASFQRRGLSNRLPHPQMKSERPRQRSRFRIRGGRGGGRSFSPGLRRGGVRRGGVRGHR